MSDKIFYKIDKIDKMLEKLEIKPDKELIEMGFISITKDIEKRLEDIGKIKVEQVKK